MAKKFTKRKVAKQDLDPAKKRLERQRKQIASALRKRRRRKSNQ